MMACALPRGGARYRTFKGNSVTLDGARRSPRGVASRGNWALALPNPT